ncbi:hypothetical protein KY339_04000 [Candidatus Woesearchaeota archaeon]|nr:hypothetical protein [Candidatus Woesearchaeota archaeon]
MQNLEIDGVRYTCYVNLKTKIFVRRGNDLELDIDETLKANHISIATSDGQYHDIRDKLLDEARDSDNCTVLRLFMRDRLQRLEPVVQPKNTSGRMWRPFYFYTESPTQEELEMIYKDMEKQKNI